VSTAQPILVTGAHRSGTTWVGRILATSPSVAYLHEPFHIGHDPGMCAARFDYWFTYVCEENEEPYLEPLRKMLDGARRGAPDAAQRTSHRRPLIKDPIAVFSAAWLASRFETRNVVMIRHPAAFAGSLKEKGWTHPFAHFLLQPLLMRDHLGTFAADILRFAREERDIVDQAALLWNVIHSMILRYRKHHPEWIYVRHEDLSRDPVDGFRVLFDKVGLELSAETERAIMTHSFAMTASGLQRDSLASIDTWKKRLTGAEIERVRARVSALASHFYSDQEW
jgi:Sulfotransferase family